MEFDRWFSDDPDLADQVVVPASVRQRWQAMGAVAESSGAVEVCLQQIFVALMDTRRASIVASGQNAGWLVDNCLAILREPSFSHTEDTRELIKVLERAPGVLRSRNDLLHAFWVRHEGRDARVNTRYRKGPTLNPVEAAELASAAQRLGILEELLADLGYRIFGDKMSWHSVAVGWPESVTHTVNDLDPDAPSRRAAPGPSLPVGEPAASEQERRAAQYREIAAEVNKSRYRLDLPDRHDQSSLFWIAEPINLRLDLNMAAGTGRLPAARTTEPRQPPPGGPRAGNGRRRPR